MEPYNLYRKWNGGRSTLVGKPNDTIRVLFTITIGIIIGFCIGVSFPSLPLTKLNITSTILHDLVKISNKSIANSTKNCKVLTTPSSTVLQTNKTSKDERKLNITSTILHDLVKISNKSIANSTKNSKVLTTPSSTVLQTNKTSKDERKIWVPTNPKGAESLPPGIVVSDSDFYLRRLWGRPNEDLTIIPKYLVTFAVGYEQRHNIDAAVKKFSGNFTVMLFHYDGKTSEWDEFEWSKRAIHVSARKQTKWWFAKRFLHPDIVAPYDYIFIWDEDLGVENFDAEKYIDLVRKHRLEISQPAIQANGGITWQMTKRRGDVEVHKEAQERPHWCNSPLSPPCAGFVEIMAPVFSRDAWRCVWHMIQNDLVHGWGLDFALQRCVETAHERIGVVDAQWVVHQHIPSLGNQGQEEAGKAPWHGVRFNYLSQYFHHHSTNTQIVRQRCKDEWAMFTERMEKAEKEYYKSIGIDTSSQEIK